MKLKKLTPNIIVDNVNKTVEYYSNLFGFNTLATVPETGDFVFAMVQKDELTLMFQSKHIESTPSFKESEIGGTITLYIDVENIEELFAKAKEFGAELLSDIFETFYGTREFVMKDLNGYVLIFAEDKAE